MSKRPVTGKALMSAPPTLRLRGRDCGVAGAGRSPNRNPGRNCAPPTGFGDDGEPKDIGSIPYKAGQKL